MSENRAKFTIRLSSDDENAIERITEMMYSSTKSKAVLTAVYKYPSLVQEISDLKDKVRKLERENAQANEKLYSIKKVFKSIIE